MPPEDLHLLRWKIVDIIRIKVLYKELAMKVLSGNYSDLDVICRQLELKVTQLHICYWDLLCHCEEHQLMYVWTQLGFIWDYCDVMKFD